MTCDIITVEAYLLAARLFASICGFRDGELSIRTHGRQVFFRSIQVIYIEFRVVINCFASEFVIPYGSCVGGVVYGSLAISRL